MRLRPLTGRGGASVPPRGVGPIQTSAVVNSGYEAEDRELLIPLRLAAALGLDPKADPNVQLADYDTAGGPVQVARIADAVELRIEVEGREAASAVATAVLSDVEDEVLINDALAEALGIHILAPRAGMWAFADDPAGTMRPSARPVLW